MSLADATDANQTSSHESWQASLELRFGASSHQAGRTILSHNRHAGPLLVQKALHPEGPAVCHCIILHPPAGIAAGDQLKITVDVDQGAHALLSTPSATRWYKSPGKLASQNVELRIERDAKLEWLPEENLFYEDVNARQSLVIDLDASAKLLAWDGFMLGRTASGDPWRAGQARLETRIRRNGELLYTERGLIDALDARFDGALGLNGFRCGATLYAAGVGITTEQVEQLAPSLSYHPDLMAGCSEVAPGLMMLRILGRESSAVKQLLHRVWADLRPTVIGVEPRPLRLWAC